MLYQQYFVRWMILFTTIHGAKSSGTSRNDVSTAQLHTYHQCGNTTTFCTTDAICCESEYSPTKTGCQNLIPEDSYCCKPGPSKEPIPSLPNCLIIGDSVSVGYTPIATKILESVCQLQHGPFDVSDGGAGDTSYGLQCLPNFLVSQRQTPVVWDVILFNFGLHNLVNTDAAKKQYRKELLGITMQLVLRMPSAKLIYATTTPLMTDALQNNSIVEDLNDIARDMLQEQFSSKSIEILDLHKVVTDHCGIMYESCDFCDENPCSFHYSSLGYTELGKKVAEAIMAKLLEV